MNDGNDESGLQKETRILQGPVKYSVIINIQTPLSDYLQLSPCVTKS